MTSTLDAPHNAKSEQDSVPRRLTGTRFATVADPCRPLHGACVIPDQSCPRSLLRKSVHAELTRLEAFESESDVILTGVVRSYYLKQMAQETVRPALAGRRLHNEVVVLPASADEPLLAAPLRIVIATGDADWSGGCVERLRAMGHAVERIGSGLDLMAALRSRLPDVLVVADPLPWGGADGVITCVGELDLLRRVKVIHTGMPETLARLPAELRDQLAEVIVGNDCTADLVARAVERALAD